TIVVEFELGDGAAQARRWKTPVTEAAKFLRVIEITTKLGKVCCQLDVTRTDSSLIDLIRLIECENLKIEHQEAKSVIERRSGFKTVDEAATLNLAFFSSNADFFPSVTTLTIRNVRMAEEDYAPLVE
ncbi:hypothetical protein PMAYCL1PPCAC_25359, partial [Pristionchus mayeri]